MDIDFKTLVFFAFATILVIAALRVITVRNPVHAALWLVLSFFSAGGIWMLLEAEFLAIALVLVYVGAVMVLFLFVVMMLDINLERLRKGFWANLVPGLVVGGLVLFEMVMVLAVKNEDLSPGKMPLPPLNATSNTKELGLLIYTDYVYPFELAAVLLLVAIIAAIALTMRKRPGSKAIDPALQIAVKAKDRMRIVSMPVEKE